MDKHDDRSHKGWAVMRGRFVCQQVRILLERMDSHPDEFVESMNNRLARALGNKWDSVLTYGQFTLVEKYLIKRKIRALRREVTKQHILMTIMGHEERNEDFVPWTTTGKATMATLSDQQNQQHKDYITMHNKGLL